MPGIGTTCSPCASSHASATCAGVASWRAATALTRSTSAALASIASGWKRGLFLRKSPGGNVCGASVPVRKPRPERRERQERRAVRGAPRHDLGERVARPQRALGLHGGDGVDRVRALELVDAHLGQAERADLALRDQLGHRAPGLLQRHLGVDAVQLVEVDEVGPQAPAASPRSPRARAPGRPSLRSTYSAASSTTSPHLVARTTSSRRPAIAAPDELLVRVRARTCRPCRAGSRRGRARGGSSRSTPSSSRSASP